MRSFQVEDWIGISRGRPFSVHNEKYQVAVYANQIYILS